VAAHLFASVSILQMVASRETKCTHGTRKAYCLICCGKGICEHSRRRVSCAVCVAAKQLILETGKNDVVAAAIQATEKAAKAKEKAAKKVAKSAKEAAKLKITAAKEKIAEQEVRRNEFVRDHVSNLATLIMVGDAIKKIVPSPFPDPAGA
jgi:hypothetical protein